MRADREVIHAVSRHLAPDILIVDIADVLALIGVKLHVVHVGIDNIVCPRVVPSAYVDHLVVGVLAPAFAQHLQHFGAIGILESAVVVDDWHYPNLASPLVNK